MLIESIKYDGIAKVFKVVSIAYLYPIILVLFSIILGDSKATEVDGSISYVGGYYHEGLISIIILTAMSIFVLMAVEENKIFKQLYLIIFFLFLLIMVNYRTTLLASLFICIFVLFAIYKNARILNKSLTILLVFMIAMGTTMLAPSHLFERFQEIPDAISQYSNFINLPEYYSSEERKFFSGRIYIWSAYISDALDGTGIQLFFGQGMDAWKDHFRMYAHNTFVSFFYELGIIGLGIFSILIVNLYRKILQIRESGIYLPLCGVYTAFLVLNLGTMPLWQLEGIILFSLIIAISEYYVHRKKIRLTNKSFAESMRANIHSRQKKLNPQ